MSNSALEVSTIQSLGRKLDEFAEVLTPEEHAVLLGLISTAGATLEAGHAEADTEGVTDKAILTQSTRLPNLSVGLKDAFKNLPGVSDPLGPVADSIGVGVACVSWSKDYNKVSPVDKVGLSKITGLKQYR
ncbi:hypothetical protein FG147_10690 [Thauera sp. UPWRP]|nr:hypothetical protein FG147_10690 [Thauera sp. UPWRP]